MNLLQESIIYLLAAIVMVSVSRRLGFGSVLGYLAAGIVIGPFGIALIHDPEHILHFAEASSYNRHDSGSCEKWSSDWAPLKYF